MVEPGEQDGQDQQLQQAAIETGAPARSTARDLLERSDRMLRVSKPRRLIWWLVDISASLFASSARAGLVGVSHRHGGPVTTQRDQEARPAPDLVDRKLSASGPNQIGVADIAYAPRATGSLHLAVALDVWSRKRIYRYRLANAAPKLKCGGEWDRSATPTTTP